ncbi:hypothetical protein AAHC03_026395 [Spirometra sp. Aus1]
MLAQRCWWIVASLVITRVLCGFSLFSQSPTLRKPDYRLPPENQSEKENMQRRLPNCLIIGVRKGGTRALLNFLAEHPGIKVARSEQHFFDRDSNYVRGLEWYRSRMPLAHPNDWVIEKTPAYFHTPGVARRIHEFNPNIRLLLVVRDPLERAVSDYLQLQQRYRNMNRSNPSIEESFLEAGDRQRIRSTYGPVRLSCYSNFIRPWLVHFSLEQLLLVNGDALLTQPAKVLEGVEGFLGLAHYLTEDRFYLHPQRGLFCLQKPGEEGCLSRSKGRRHPGVPPALLATLWTHLQPCALQFQRLVNVTFAWPRLVSSIPVGKQGSLQ